MNYVLKIENARATSSRITLVSVEIAFILMYEYVSAKFTQIQHNIEMSIKLR